MRRSIPILIGIALLAFGLSACDANVTPVAAKVNGQTISVDTLNATLNSIKTDAGFRCFTQAESTNSGAVFGAGTDTFSSKFVDGQLDFLMNVLAVHQGLVALGLGKPNALANSVALTELKAAFTAQSGVNCKQTPAEVINNLEPTTRQGLLQYFADETTLAAHLSGLSLTPAGIKAYEQAHASAVYNDCVDAIIVASKATADNLISQLNRGASFAAVAKANSIDTSSSQQGGRVGCFNPSGLSVPLNTVVANLKVGQVSAPVSLQNDWVILKVDSQSFPGTVEAAANITGTVAASSDFNAALAKLTHSAKVEVSPQYGSAVVGKSNIQVNPVVGPKDADILNVLALSSPSS